MEQVEDPRSRRQQPAAVGMVEVAATTEEEMAVADYSAVAEMAAAVMEM